jgi:hypothetical protein
LNKITSGRVFDNWVQFGGRKTIARGFKNFGYEIKWSTIDEPPNPNEWIISLLDIENSFLKELSPANFDAIKRYMAHAKGCKIIWITNSIHCCCPNPDIGLTLGFVRTLRQELQLDLGTLEVDTFDSTTVKAIEGIMRKMCLEKSSFTSGPDYEFCLHGGCLNVGSFFWGHPENAPQVPRISICPSQLRIRSLGLLNTLEWQEVDPQNIGDDDVDIEMHYLGLNFKVCIYCIGKILQY